jgi:diguanylate cyclase
LRDNFTSKFFGARMNAISQPEALTVATTAAQPTRLDSVESGAKLADILDEHLDWLCHWHRLAFLVTEGREQAVKALPTPLGFMQWRQSVGTQPALEKLAALHDQMHLLARLTLMRTPDGMIMEAADYEAVIGKFQGFMAGARRLERAFAIAAAGLDTLTGLRSRVGMSADVTRELERSRRAGKSFCLAILDIDHFKRVNDTYGHDVGDQVLATAANVISRQIRSFDDAFRLGGEEFVICLKDTSLADAAGVLERLRLALAEWPIPVAGHETPLKVTASFGLTQASVSSDFEQLLNIADQALYDAKRQGRNRIIVKEIV